MPDLPLCSMGGLGMRLHVLWMDACEGFIYTSNTIKNHIMINGCHKGYIELYVIMNAARLNAYYTLCQNNFHFSH